MPARSILAQYAIVFPLHSRNSPGRTKTYGASRSAARVVGCPNGAKQRTDSYRVNNSGAVYHLGRRQGAAQIHRWIPLRPAGGDGVPKDHPAGAAQSSYRFV
jgi:hypothetical protein